MKSRGINNDLHHDDGRGMPAAPTGAQQSILSHLVDAAQSLQAAHELARDAGRSELAALMREANKLVGKTIHASCEPAASIEVLS